MTPYLQLRLWWHRGSSGDRLAATLALAVVLALAAWALVPATADKDRTGLRVDTAGASATAAAAGNAARPDTGGPTATENASGNGPAAAGPGTTGGTATIGGGTGPAAGASGGTAARTGDASGGRITHSARPYRGALPTEKVLSILGEGRGTQLCPATLDAVYALAARDELIASA